MQRNESKIFPLVFKILKKALKKLKDDLRFSNRARKVKQRYQRPEKKAYVNLKSCRFDNKTFGTSSLDKPSLKYP